MLILNIFRFQDIMCKIKKVLVDEKRHIRFGEWNGNDVSFRKRFS